jgi:dipeptidyl aminopeptidase/acylaminoacyl peptidase
MASRSFFATARMLSLVFGGVCSAWAAADGATARAADPAAATATFAAGTPAYLKDVPLIPRQTIFGNPERGGASISPDGKHLSYLAPVDGVMNVWVAPVDDLAAARPVTFDKKRGVVTNSWAYTNQHILYAQDADGDENDHIFRVDVATGATTDLTPIKGVAAKVVAAGPRKPDQILVGLNDRDPRYHDLYLVDLNTGERKLVQTNDREFGEFFVDRDYNVRLAAKMTDDGGMLILEPTGDGNWREFDKFPMSDTMTTMPCGFDKTGKTLYMQDSRGRDTGALYSIDLATRARKLIVEDPRADLGGILRHPTEFTLQAVSFDYTRIEWTVLDESIRGDFDYLKTVADGELIVASRTLDDQMWTVAYMMDNGPIRSYLYDRKARKAKYLFSNRTDWDGLPWVKMHPVVIEARDGLKLVSYLTLPPGTDPDGDGKPSHPVPMVLEVHGGPWARDHWCFNSDAQLYANRGYAVLSVNFRGSDGFGKKFLNAGNKEWGGKMHDDLLDAVKWAVDGGIADPKKVAISGGSYGGYAALGGLTFTPDVFACAIDVVGPSNILTFLATIPAYWESGIRIFKDRVGDFTSDEGKKFLTERSPLTHVEKIKRPLLIGHGANDPRVKQSEADQIVQVMQEKKIPVTYVLFPDEGHGWARPANKMAFSAVTEAFLAEHLGGRFEPIGKDFEGSTIRVPTGAENVPGLVGKVPAETAKKGDAGGEN